jgi:flavin-binding protein dodecin
MVSTFSAIACSRRRRLTRSILSALIPLTRSTLRADFTPSLLAAVHTMPAKGVLTVADDKVYKLVEIVGTSDKGFAEAVRAGVERAAETLRNVDWFEVTEMRGRVAKKKVTQFQVKMKVGFRLE